MRLLLAAFISLLLAGSPIYAQPAPAAIPAQFEVENGSPLPAALAKAVDDAYSGPSTATKATLIQFVNCASPRCGESLDALEGFVAKPYASRGAGKAIRLAAVAVRATAKEADVLRKERLSFPVIADTDGALFASVAKDGVPRTLIANSKGEIVYRQAGWKSGREAEFRAVIEALLRDQPLPRVAGAQGQAPPSAPRGGAGRQAPGGYSDDLNAIDIRGQDAPEVPVETWITPLPANAEGKYVLVDFWATWCGPCVRALKEAEKVHGQFDDRLVTMAISDEPVSRVKPFLIKNGIKAPVGVDTKARAKSKLGVTAIPHAFLKNPQGKVIWQGHPMELWGNNGRGMKQALDKDAASKGQ